MGSRGPLKGPGKAPGEVPGGSAPESSWILAYLKCPERLDSLTLFFFKKMIDGTPKTRKSTLCHNILSTQQTELSV